MLSDGPRGFDSHSAADWLDIARIACQLLVNALFCARDLPGVGWTPLSRADPCAAVASCGLRETLFVLQALLYVVVYSNLLYFFRAFLSFAVLVHVFLTILVDIVRDWASLPNPLDWACTGCALLPSCS